MRLYSEKSEPARYVPQISRWAHGQYFNVMHPHVSSSSDKHPAGKYTNQAFRFKTPAASGCVLGLGFHLKSSMTNVESPSCPWDSAFPELVFRAIYPHDLIALQHGEMNFSIT